MKMKKLLTFVLTAAMTLGLTACGGGSGDGSGSAANSSDGVGAAGSDGSAEAVQNVVVAIPTLFDINDSQMVADAINEIAADKYGVTVTLEFIAVGNWAQQTNLLLTSDEVDVLAFYSTPLTTFIKNNQALPLEDYVENASDAFKAVWSDAELQGTSMNGHIYAIPNLRNFGNTRGLDIDEKIAAEFGIEDGQHMTLDEVSEFLYAAHEAYPDRYAIVPQGGSNMVSGWTWDGLGDSKFIGVLEDCGQDLTVKNLFETDDFTELCTYTRQWYADGLSMADALSNTEDGKKLIQAGKAVACLENYAVDTAEGCIRTVIVDAWAVSNSYAELCYGINTNSSKPDAAWKALEMFYVDQDICELLTNGIEGTHYTVNEDGTTTYTENGGYNISAIAWVLPYSGYAHPIDANGPAYFEDLIAFNDSCMKSKGLGFAFDSTSVANQYTACCNVMDKYYAALMCGTVDVESTIAQANAELEAAGLSDIISAKQEQLDAFLSAR